MKTSNVALVSSALKSCACSADSVPLVLPISDLHFHFAPSLYATTTGCCVVLSGRPAPASSVSPAMASVELEPAGSCEVQTIDPSLRESATTSPVNVVVKTRSLATVAPPNGI